ncbi:hypothetical protein [Streptomyces sp. NPDC019224]|uniref:hypothetical protein n=1 Tax=Streptomyces sp. NPDC019224 TaxID=3154484 RepID=UPI0033C8096C
MSRPGSSGLRFGMFAVCVVRDSDPGLNRSKAKALYDLLVSYADVSSRDTGRGYPYREALASYLDCSKQTVDRASEYLEKEIGLVTVHRRKVEGKPDENDANLYELHDSWLIHGVTPPAGTPPQLVARYGDTVPGLDVGAWIAEHAPDFDLAGWSAAHEEKKRAQQAKREEQRRAERARRKKPKKGGGPTGDATPGGAASEGGDVTGDAPGGVTGDVTGGVTGDALSTTVAQDPSSTAEAVADAVGRGAGGLARAGSSAGAADETGEAGSGAAASEPSSLPEQRKQSPRPATVKTRPRKESAGFEMVRAAIPAAVTGPGTKLWTGLHRAINDLLDGNEAAGIPSRTPEQVIARLNRRWYGENADERTAADYEGDDRIRNRCSWLAAAILAQDCPDPSCEDGEIIGGGSCRNCQERREEAREAAGAAAKAKAKLEADTAALVARKAVVGVWAEREAAEEATIRQRLGESGMYGQMLDHHVGRHMAGWRDRNHRPSVPAARSTNDRQVAGA